MSSGQSVTKDSSEQMGEIIANTEASLALLGFMYYYLVQLPQHRYKLTLLKAQEPR